MKTYTLEQFQDRTALLPAVIADVIAGNNPAFAAHVETKTLTAYNHNPAFRRKMNGAKSREWLYAFVAHWFDAYTKRSR